MLALLLIGAAFARPVLLSSRRAMARVVVADRSASVASIAEVTDSLRAFARPGDRMLTFDSTVTMLSHPGVDSLTAGAGTGSLSAALLAARRTGSELSLEVDSVELVLVAPLLTEEWDGATATIRALWPGRVRLIAVRPRDDSAVSPALAFDAGRDDPLGVTSLLARSRSGDARVRLERSSHTPVDARWVEGGGTWVAWPADGAPPGWSAILSPDTVGAVVAGDQAVVFPFERRWGPDSASLLGARVVARWVDGAPAALERSLGSGCIRTVTIGISGRGDFAVRPDVVRLFRALSGPCAGAGPVQLLGAGDRAILAGSGRLASRGDLRPPEAPETPLIPWLLAAALLLALLELWVRRRRPVADGNSETAASLGRTP